MPRRYPPEFRRRGRPPKWWGFGVDFRGGNPRDVDGHRHPQRQDSRMRRDDRHSQDGRQLVRGQAARGRRRRPAAWRRPGARPGADGDRGLHPDRRGAVRTDRLSHRLPQRVPDPELGHAGRHDRASDPQGERRHLLPLAAGAPPTGGAGAAGGDRGGVREGHLHPQGRRPGPGAGDGRHLQVRGLPALQGPGRGREGVPRPTDRGGAPLRVAGRHLPQDPGGRPGDLGRHRPRRGVSEAGHRGVLGVDTGPSEDHAFWTSFLRSLVERGLRGVRLAISDAHEGLRQAIAKVLGGATWQRCRVHVMRNLLATVPETAQDTVAAIVRTIFIQPDHPSAMAQLHEVAGVIRGRSPRPPICSRTPPRTCSPTCTSRGSTADGCTPRTRSSGCTRRSSGAPTWSQSSPTLPRWCGWSRPCSRSKTTNGGSRTAAPSASVRWRDSTRSRG